MVKVTFWSQDTTKVRASWEVATAARQWQLTLQQVPRVFLCRPHHELAGAAAADASASQQHACIGGWWSTRTDPQDPKEIFWFSLWLSHDDFPAHYELHEDLGRNIIFFEALAQLVLFVLRTAKMNVASPRNGRGCSTVIRLRQLCDNASSVGAINKLHTMSKPLDVVLQAFAHHASVMQAKVAVTHIAGERNIWADRLSRPDWYPEFTRQLLANRKQHLDAGSLRRILGGQGG